MLTLYFLKTAKVGFVNTFVLHKYARKCIDIRDFCIFIQSGTCFLLVKSYFCPNGKPVSGGREVNMVPERKGFGSRSEGLRNVCLSYIFKFRAVSLLKFLYRFVYFFICQRDTCFLLRFFRLHLSVSGNTRFSAIRKCKMSAVDKTSNKVFSFFL